MRYLAVLVLAISFLLLGCSAFYAVPASALTPEQAVERANPLPNGAHRTYAVKHAPQGALVVYQDNVNPDNAEITLGYSFVTRQAQGWVVSETGGMGASTQGESIVYSTNSPRPPGNLGIVYGKFLNTSIQSIAVLFANGQELYDQSVNGLFGMVTEVKTPLCRIRLLGAQGQIIETIDFKHPGSPPPPLDTESLQRAQRECP